MLSLHLDDFDRKALVACLKAVGDDVPAAIATDDKGGYLLEPDEDGYRAMREALTNGADKIPDYYRDTARALSDRIGWIRGEAKDLSAALADDKGDAWAAADPEIIERLVEIVEQAVAEKKNVPAALAAAGFSHKTDYGDSNLYDKVWELAAVTEHNRLMDAGGGTGILHSRFCTLYALPPRNVEALPHLAPFRLVVGRIGNTANIVIAAALPEASIERRRAAEEARQAAEEIANAEREARRAPVDEALQEGGFTWRGSFGVGSFGSAEYKNYSEFVSTDAETRSYQRILVDYDCGEWEHQSLRASVSDGRVTGYYSNGGEVVARGADLEALVEHLKGLAAEPAAPRM